jgi:hypothetical protein
MSFVDLPRLRYFAVCFKRISKQQKNVILFSKTNISINSGVNSIETVE